MRWNQNRLIKIKPPGFIEPALAAPTDLAPSGSRWLHEVKHDGYRLLARLHEGEVRLWSRHRTNFTTKFPQIVDAMKALPVRTAFFDGEVVCEVPSGHHDLDALRTLEGCRRAVYIGFDLLVHDDEDIRSLALVERRGRLEEVLREAAGPLRFSAPFEGDGEEIFAHACALGVEGIVSKLKDAPYRSGRTRTWLKRKCPGYR
jgi:bifunctional non-homologous end joining protein LigD